jgi:hypothetical protein
LFVLSLPVTACMSVQNIAAAAAAAAACASLAPALRVREHQSAICMQRAGEVA